VVNTDFHKLANEFLLDHRLFVRYNSVNSLMLPINLCDAACVLGLRSQERDSGLILRCGVRQGLWSLAPRAECTPLGAVLAADLAVYDKHLLFMFPRKLQATSTGV